MSIWTCPCAIQRLLRHNSSLLCKIFIKNNLTIPKTHAGLIAKLWQNRRELGIEENTIKNISRIQSLRESGDYGVIPSVEENDLRMVEDVIKKLKEVLEC